MSRTALSLNKWREYLRKKPLIRGMVTYSVTWPIGSLVQQTFESKEYSWTRMLKFSLYGGLFVAPTIYGWMTISCIVFPKPTLMHSAIKGLVEQILYSPFTISCFFFIMTILDGGSVEAGIQEVSNKLIPTWKIAALFWPFVQTVNYSFIPERNRVPFLGVCSLGWTVFLAFVKYQQEKANRLTAEKGEI